MTRPPSGYPPPATAALAEGETLDLRRLAEEIAGRYLAEFPDERRHHGDVAVAWCVHDNQHILNWAVNEWKGYGGLERQLAWLGGVLEARHVPVDRLARDLDIAAAVLEGELPPPHRGLARTVASAAGFVRSRGSFLSPS